MCVITVKDKAHSTQFRLATGRLVYVLYAYTTWVTTVFCTQPMRAYQLSRKPRNKMTDTYSIRLRGDKRLSKGWSLRTHKPTGLQCFIRGGVFIPVHEVMEFREAIEDTEKRMKLDERRLALVHAALRLWQDPQHCMTQELLDIATNTGTLALLSDEEIEDFIEVL